MIFIIIIILIILLIIIIIETRRAFRQAVLRCPEAEERAKQRNSP